MIRHIRRTSVLIAFCVLTSAATAYAECAWVLWWNSGGTTGEPVRAWPPRQK